ncbi:MAG: MBL fold metallo-hydrolase [Acidobacteria bacterium]|nr:MBL fold metallo-hydrolase [Acidobacteriota bacterium]
MIGGGTAFASSAGLGYVLYRQFPLFWQQYIHEMRLPMQTAPRIPDASAWPDRGLHAAWLGHSTVLLKVDGFTILTDPVFSSRAGLDLHLLTLGLKRRVAPAMRIEDLPPVDLILLSHAHMDHLDTPSLGRLENKRTRVIMASQTSDLIRAGRYANVTELGWGEKAQAGPALVRAFEVNHWGARMRTDTYRGYNGYVIEAGRRRILFAGDTAITDKLRNLRTMGGIDLAIMPIGAYNPWIRFHCTPEQAWRMGNDAGAEFFLPVHHQTFHLSREPIMEPIERFLTAAGARAGRVVTRGIGEEFHLG